MTTADEKKILEEVDAFVDAWNHGDAKSAASFYTQDGVRYGATGDMEQGLSELEKGYRLLFEQVLKGATIKLGKSSVQMLTSDFAIWRGEINIQPVDSRPAITGAVLQVMKKVGKRWLIYISDGKFFPLSR